MNKLIEKYREYLFFVTLVLMFLVVAISSLLLYLSWDEPLEDSQYVEVNLPIIEWAKYTSLSKQYQGGKIEEINL